MNALVWIWELHLGAVSISLFEILVVFLRVVDRSYLDLVATYMHVANLDLEQIFVLLGVGCTSPIETNGTVLQMIILHLFDIMQANNWMSIVDPLAHGSLFECFDFAQHESLRQSNFEELIRLFVANYDF